MQFLYLRFENLAPKTLVDGTIPVPTGTVPVPFHIGTYILGPAWISIEIKFRIRIKQLCTVPKYGTGTRTLFRYRYRKPSKFAIIVWGDARGRHVISELNYMMGFDINLFFIVSGLGRSASSVGPNARGRHVITKPLRRSKSQLPGVSNFY